MTPTNLPSGVPVRVCQDCWWYEYENARSPSNHICPECMSHHNIRRALLRGGLLTIEIVDESGVAGGAA